MSFTDQLQKHNISKVILNENFQIKKTPTVYIASEIYDGNNAWYITTWSDKDIFDENPDQFYRFLKSFTLVGK